MVNGLRKIAWASVFRFLFETAAYAEVGNVTLQFNVVAHVMNPER
jgi:hypothetical protein